MSDLKQELCNFEGSDALGVGDFSVCLRATVRIAELEAEVKGWRNEDKKKQTACEQMVRRIVELENLVAYLCGKNTDHIRVALAGNPTVVDAVVARAEAALERGKKE